MVDNHARKNLSILFRILDKTCGFVCCQAKHFGMNCCEVTEKIIVDYEAGEL